MEVQDTDGGSGQGCSILSSAPAAQPGRTSWPRTGLGSKSQDSVLKGAFSRPDGGRDGGLWCCQQGQDKAGEGRREGFPLGCAPCYLHLRQPRPRSRRVLGAAGRAFLAHGHLQGLVCAHSHRGWKISRKSVPTPRSALKNPLRSCGGAGGATGAVREGKPRCETRPRLPDEPWQHPWVGFFYGHSREVDIVQPFQCGVMARTISGIKKWILPNPLSPGTSQRGLLGFSCLVLQSQILLAEGLGPQGQHSPRSPSKP